MTAITLTLEVIAKPSVSPYLTYIKECLKLKIVIDKTIMTSFIQWAHTFYPSTRLSSMVWDQVSRDAYSRSSLEEIINEIETKFIPGVVLQTFYTECEYYPQLNPHSIYASLDTTNLPKWADTLEMKLTYALLPPKVKVPFTALRLEDDPLYSYPLGEEEPKTEDNPLSPLPPNHPGFRHL